MNARFVGSPAIDLAHATLPTSTLWHPEVGKILTPGQVAGFYAHYLARIGKAVEIGMDHRQTHQGRIVDLDDRETRRRHLALVTQRRNDRARQGGLTGAQPSG